MLPELPVSTDSRARLTAEQPNPQPGVEVGIAIYGRMSTTPANQTSLTRRTFLGLTAAAAALGAGYFFGFDPLRRGGYTLKHSKPMMGTMVNFTIIGPDQESCHDALQNTAAHMNQYSQAINHYNPASQLSQLNKYGIIEDGHPTLIKVTRMSIEMSRLTAGAFDPTVLPLLSLYKNVRQGGVLPAQATIEEALSYVDYQSVIIDGTTIRYAKPGMGMTLDGLGKGHIVDEGVRFINALGYSSVCIEAGGDLKVTGTKRSGEPWTIAIRNPRPGEAEEQIFLKMENMAIATSGDYMQAFTPDRRHHHIINPQTGFSSPELASSSILAPSVAQADGLATAAMVMGPQKSIALLDTLPDCEGFLVGKDLSTYSSKDFFKYHEKN